MSHPQNSAADQHEFQVGCAMCSWHTALSSARIAMMALCNVVDLSEANGQYVQPHAQDANVRNVCVAQPSPCSAQKQASRVRTVEVVEENEGKCAIIYGRSI